MELTEDNRVNLDGIVNKMIQNKESDENIKLVVEDFKSKYITEQPKIEQKGFSSWVGSIRENVIKPLGFAGGAVAGGLLGAPAGGIGAIPGGIAGATLGGAGLPQVYDRVTDLFGITKPKPTLDIFKQAGQEGAEAGINQMTGEVVGPAISWLSGTYKGADALIRRGIEKAIRPSVVGKSTYKLSEGYIKKAIDAVKYIGENKAILKLTDDVGNPIVGELPKNLKQFSQSIDQMKGNVFSQYDSMVKNSGGMTKQEFYETYWFHGKGETHPLFGNKEITGGVTKDYNLASGYADKGKGTVDLIKHENLPVGARDYLSENVGSRTIGAMGIESGKAEITIPANIKEPFEYLVKKGIIKSKPMIELRPIVNELNVISASNAVIDNAPEVARYAAKRSAALTERGAYTAQEAQDAIAILNKRTEAFNRNPSFENATLVQVDALVANHMRKGLDNAIEGAVGEGYQALKNTYGSLKAIEKDVNSRAIVDSRKNIKGLIDFSDIWSGSEIIQGVLSMNPVVVGKGIAAKTIASFYKHINNPNTIIEKMFSGISESGQSRISKETGKAIGKAGAYSWLKKSMTANDIQQADQP